MKHLYLLSLILITTVSQAVAQLSPLVMDTVGVSPRVSSGQRGGGATWWPYPVIFIHGLGGDWYSWGAFGDGLYEGGFVYGGQLQFCLNADYSDFNVSSTDIADFLPASLPAADFYDINFNCDPSGSCYAQDIDGFSNSVLSNQSAIVKQGKALGLAIEAVLQATGKSKVVLMGHSMGGLCAREYLQNPSNWPDSQHHVAKLITSGTPHGGSNATFVDAIPGIDERSEAVRDLREFYAASLYDGAYLYGGQEYDYYIQNSLLWEYYNVDVNCNGFEGNSVTGLNYKYMPYDLDFAIIKSDWNWLLNGGDGVVDDYNADLENYYPGIPDLEKFWSTDTDDNGHSNYMHTEMPDDFWTNMHALDEPDDYHLSYEIETETFYAGFITLQGINANYSTDYDDYIFDITESGYVSVQVSELSYQWGVSVYDYTNDVYLATQQANWNPLTSIFNVPVTPGQYIIEIFGNPYEESWLQPYTFIVNHHLDPVIVTSTETDLIQPHRSIYPNPSNGIIHIPTAADGTMITVMDLAGKHVLRESSAKTIDLSALPSGHYFIQYLSTNGHQVVEKAVLVR